MDDPTNIDTEPQILVPQALLQEMQRQLQELQAAAALHAAPTPTSPVTPRTPETISLNLAGQHLKPTRPTRYSGIKDYTTIENWIASVNSYFALTGANPLTFTIGLTPTSRMRPQFGFGTITAKTKLRHLPGKKSARLSVTSSLLRTKTAVFTMNGLSSVRSRPSLITSDAFINSACNYPPWNLRTFSTSSFVD